jgi:RNA polymerase primary sigma factor
MTDESAVLERVARGDGAGADGSRSRRRASATTPLDDAKRLWVYHQYRRGVPLVELAAQVGRSIATVGRAVDRQRARRLLEQELNYMPHPSFEDASARDEILGPMPDLPEGRERRTDVPQGLPPYLASLYEDPLLTREQERHQFRKMNFLKYEADRRRRELDPARPKTADLDAIERLLQQALDVKNQIIRANLRLVVSLAKRHLAQTSEFFELVSDGNMALIRAVEKFDFARGNKFSTYASWAVLNNFARSIPKEKLQRDRFRTGHEEIFDAAADRLVDEPDAESSQGRHRELVAHMLGRLGEREQKILVSRFGLGGTAAQTLEQLGKELGVTKERVRQIEARAQAKLRQMASEEELDLTSL